MECSPQKKETAKKIKTFCTISLLVIRASGAKRSQVNLTKFVLAKGIYQNLKLGFA